MSSYNRGEWSELYGVLFLLLKPKIEIVDSKLEKINKLIYEIKKIILDSKIKLEYVIHKDYILVYADEKEIGTMSRTEIEKEKEIILAAIKNNKETNGAFCIPKIDEFLQKITQGVPFKSKSHNKYDIITESVDLLKEKEVDVKYSVKSSLGSPATILNASSNTNFKYLIKNFPKDQTEKINSIDGKTKLLDRIKAIHSISKDIKIEYYSVPSKEFEYNLKMVDSLMPKYLANALLYSYENNNKNLLDAFKLSNPEINDDVLVKKKLGDLLNAISFGFIPSEKWNGVNSVNGGLIIIKEDGSVVSLDLTYYPQEVANYLINESKLESPSSSRYHMLELKIEDGEVFFTLNLQIRYK